MYHVGYLGYYWVSQQQINQKWLESVEYTGQVKEVSIPMSLPYWRSQNEYEYTNGKFTWEGKLYRKVKQKYSDGALHIILIEDHLTQELNQSVSEWIKSITDTKNDNSGKTTVKSFVKDYIHTPVEFAYQPGFSFLSKKVSLYHDFWQNVSQDIITPPPQLV